MDLLRFRSQIPVMGQGIPDSRCSHCGSQMPVDRNRLGRLECASCDRIDPLKSDRTMGWLQGELRPPK
jgi:anaerobic ribonucleoside-triphosphate reductase